MAVRIVMRLTRLIFLVAVVIHRFKGARAQV